MTNPIIIIGAGLAGYQLAKEFRKTNQSTPLTIITADKGDFYSKPQLSTALTSGKTPSMLPTATHDAMASQLNATIHTETEVLSIDPSNKTVTTDKHTLAYEKLVLAVGATVIQPNIAGDAANNILSINHIYHYSQFRDLIANKKHITVLGMGLIGCEFANDLGNAGYEVHLVAPVKAPLDLLVPEDIGLLLKKSLEENRAHFHCHATVSEMNHDNDQYRLTLSTGEILHTDFVLSAIGLKPHVFLAETAGININRGIVVNRYLQTNFPDIFALGDCAEVEGHVLPFITPLLNCSRALAQTLNGNLTAVDYPAMPVIVKTPAHPIAVCPPPANLKGHWDISSDNHNVKALFYDAENTLRGFVLTHDAVKERMMLAKQIPNLF